MRAQGLGRATATVADTRARCPAIIIIILLPALPAAAAAAGCCLVPAAGISIHRELYFAILMDRAYGGPVIVASTQGGMDIEGEWWPSCRCSRQKGSGQRVACSATTCAHRAADDDDHHSLLAPLAEVAEKNPAAIIKTPVDIMKGLTDEAATDLAGKLGFKGDYILRAVAQFKALYKLFIAT